MLLLGAIVGFAGLVASPEKPPTKIPQHQYPLVNASQVHRQNVSLMINSFGTVKPQVEIDIVPQVSGKVVALSKEFKTGGEFSANEMLITIDSSDYQLVLEKAKASIAQAQLQLDIELAEANVKRKERAVWKKLNPSKVTPALALHQQHVKRAEANLVAARVDMKKAQLNLERTVLTVPFNGRIVAESADVGQYVVAGKSLARVYGMDVLEVQVPLSDEKLSLFNLFSDDPAIASRVTVSANFSGKQRIWRGFVDRTEGVVDPDTRLVNVVIVVPMVETKERGSRLLPGMFVNVAIVGQTLAQVIPVPRNSIQENSTVWRVNDNTLEIREVDIMYSDQEFAYVVSGIDDGDLITTSLLGVVTNNMQVRVHHLEEAIENHHE